MRPSPRPGSLWYGDFLVNVLGLEFAHHTGLFERARTPAFVGDRAHVLPTQALVFISGGRVAGVLGPGDHVLDPRQIPFLGPIASPRPNGAVLGDEVLFAKTGDPVSIDVNGPLDVVQDAAVGEKVTPKISARVRVTVFDPVLALGTLAGNFDQGVLEQWVKARVLDAARELGRKTPRLVELTSPSKATELGRALGELVAPVLGKAGLGLAEMEVLAITVPDEIASRLRFMGSRSTEYADAPSAPSAAISAVGQRVRTNHGGQWHSGRVVELTGDRAKITWDQSGEVSALPLSLLEPEPRYPGAHAPGARVLAEWSPGSYYPATVRVYNGTLYEVEFAEGATRWLPPGAVRLA